MVRAARLTSVVCLVLGCAAIADHKSSDLVVVEVEIIGPAIVGFFPPVTAEQIDTQPGTREGIAHLEFAIADAKQCFAPRPVMVRGVLADVLILHTPTKRFRIELPTDWPHAVGAYLVEPGRPPVAIYATAGPSSLIVLLPNGAAEYFSEPSCRFEL